MIQCPACGHTFEEESVDPLDVDDEIECPDCERAWVVASVDPIGLEPSEGPESAFTD